MRMAAMFMSAMADLPRDATINLLDAFLHPEGIAKHITNFEEVAPAILAHLRDDASVMPAIAERMELIAAQFQHSLDKKTLTQ